MTAGRAALLGEADRALAGRDFARAAKLLEEAAATGEPDILVLLRLAGACRAGGRPRVALDAVHRALGAAPLDFTALLMRASLLDQLGATPPLRDAVRALVQPIVDEVRHAPGGDDYVRILAHLVSHPELDPSVLGAGSTPVNRRLNTVLSAASQYSASLRISK